jgi:hypothetical protein
VTFYSLIYLKTIRKKGIILGHFSIFLLIFPLLQGIIFQKHAKAEWLLLSELHMSKIGFSEIVSFVSSSFPIKDVNLIYIFIILINILCISILVYGFINIKLFALNKIIFDFLKMKSKSLNIFNAFVIIIPIFIFREFHSSLKNYYEYIYVDKSRTISFANILDIYLGGQILIYTIIVAVFIKLYNSLSCKMEKSINDSPLFYYNFLFIFSFISMIIFVNATERIYSTKHYSSSYNKFQ